MKSKYIYPLALLVILGSCNNSEQPTPAQGDSLKDSPDTLPLTTDAIPDSAYFFERDTLINSLSQKVLQALKTANFNALSKLADPEKGIRISPLAYIDTADRVLTTQQLTNTDFPTTVISWGSDEHSGEPIRMAPAAYIKKYIYPVDFLKAPRVSVNKTIGAGTTLNNLTQFYPGMPFIEYHFPGFDKKYEGMDWESLRLVFRPKGDQLYLIAIVKDNWTI